MHQSGKQSQYYLSLGDDLQWFEAKSEGFEKFPKNPFDILLDIFTEEYIENDDIDNVELFDKQIYYTNKKGNTSAAGDLMKLWQVVSILQNYCLQMLSNVSKVGIGGATGCQAHCKEGQAGGAVVAIYGAQISLSTQTSRG